MKIKKRYCQYCGAGVNYKWFCDSCKSWCVPHSWVIVVWFVLGFYIVAGVFLFALNFGDKWIHFVDADSKTAISAIVPASNTGDVTMQQPENSVSSETSAEEPSQEDNVSLEASAEPPQEEVIEVVAVQLYRELSSNPVQWHFKYDGRRLQVLGTVSSISGDTHEARIGLSMGNSVFYLYCIFSNAEDIQRVAQMSKGDLVIIEGLCPDGDSLTRSIILTDGKLVELLPSAETLPTLYLPYEELAQDVTDSPERWILIHTG